MNPNEIGAATKQFVGQLASLSAAGDIGPLLTPDNLVFGENGVSLRNTQMPPAGTPVGIYPGYSAPEAYQGRSTQAGAVYFAGAVMYKLVTGAVPPDAQSRTPGAPLLGADKPYATVINKALELGEYSRYQTLTQMQAALDQTAPVAGQQLGMPPVGGPAPAYGQAPASAAAAPATPVYGQPALATPGPTQPQPAAPAYGQAPTTQNYGQAPTAAPVTQSFGQVSTAPNTQSYGQAPVPGAQNYGQVPSGAPAGQPYGQGAPAAPAYGQQPGQPPRPMGQPAMGTPGQPGMPGQQPRPMGAPGQPGGPGQPGQQPEPKKKKKGIKGLIIALAAVVVLAVGGVVGWNMFINTQKTNLDNAFTGKDYTGFVELYDKYPQIQEGKGKEYNYSQARILMSEGKYDDALDILDELDGFEDSKEQAQAIRYTQATDLMEAGKLEDSLALFQLLAKDKYEDSASIRDSLEEYLAADALEDPMERYQAFMDMGGFLDSDDKAQEAAQPLYDEAMRLYTEDKDFESAVGIFQTLDDFEDAVVYAELCSIAIDNGGNFSAAEGVLSRLRELSTTANVEPVVMTGQIFRAFLQGNWTSSDGGGRFEFKVGDGYEFFEFPQIQGDYYITNGMMMPAQVSNTWVYFEYVSFDELIFDIEGEGTFTFTR